MSRNKGACHKRGCHTLLSRWNPGPYCWAHTDYLTDTDHPAPHMIPPTLVTSEEFIHNIAGAYDLTPADRAEYRRWVKP